MARAELRVGRAIEEIGQTIVAAWASALPQRDGDPILPLDAASLSAAFSNILNANCIAVIDKPGSGTTLPTIFIAVPYPPATYKDGLVDYLHLHYRESDTPNNPKNPFSPRPSRKRKFSEDISQAVFFGCGK